MKKLVVAGVAVCLLVLVYLVSRSGTGGPRPEDSQVRIGMSREEVRFVLGSPGYTATTPDRMGARQIVRDGQAAWARRLSQ